MASKILVVDDEISLRETLAYNLEREGYEVDAVGDGEKALEMARNSLPDLIILDIMLPGMDGLEVCRKLRREIRIPILFLSARGDEMDRVVGLEMGADDYIPKPFSMRELIARVKAHLRTTQMIRDEASQIESQEKPEKTITSGNLTIHLHRREVFLDGQPIVLKKKVYELLAFFAENQGRVFTREVIIKNLWGWDFKGESRTIDVHVRWLREKIEADPYHPVRIVTVHGIGYRFEG